MQVRATKARLSPRAGAPAESLQAGSHRLFDLRGRRGTNQNRRYSGIGEQVAYRQLRERQAAAALHLAQATDPLPELGAGLLRRRCQPGIDIPEDAPVQNTAHHQPGPLAICTREQDLLRGPIHQIEPAS